MFEKEGELYPYVFKFLTKKYNLIEEYSGFTYSDGVDIDDAKSLILNHLGISVKPDIFGKSKNDSSIIMAEGKISCKGTNLDTAVGQAITYQRFSHYVYVFFPKLEFESDGLLDYVNSSLENHGLGLLLVTEDGDVEELLEPKISQFLKSTDESVVISTINQMNETYELLYDLNPYNEDNEYGLSGSRAYLIRDFCFWLSENPDTKSNSFNEMLAEKFGLWINEYMDENELDKEFYWSRQMPGSSQKDRVKSRTNAALYGSNYLDMIELIDEEVYELTELGKALVLITENIGIPELSDAERSFFFAIAWKSPKVKKLIDIMRNLKDKVEIHKNKCGHLEIVNVNGKPKCVEENKFVKYDDLSIFGRLKFELNGDISYYKNVFWLRSEIFSSGGNKLRYKEFID